MTLEEHNTTTQILVVLLNEAADAAQDGVIQLNTANSATATALAGTASIAATALEQGVTFTADVAGSAGNSIALVFDGIDTLDTVVTAWNGANVGNEVSHDGTGTAVLTVVTTTLSGGVDGTGMPPGSAIDQPLQDLIQASIVTLQAEADSLHAEAKALKVSITP